MIDYQVRKDLDEAIETYKDQTLHIDPVIESEFLEKGVFGEDGWSIRRTLKLDKDDA